MNWCLVIYNFLYGKKFQDHPTLDYCLLQNINCVKLLFLDNIHFLTYYCDNFVLKKLN